MSNANFDTSQTTSTATPAAGVIGRLSASPTHVEGFCASGLSSWLPAAVTRRAGGRPLSVHRRHVPDLELGGLAVEKECNPCWQRTRSNRLVNELEGGGIAFPPFDGRTIGNWKRTGYAKHRSTDIDAEDPTFDVDQWRNLPRQDTGAATQIKDLFAVPRCGTIGRRACKRLGNGLTKVPLVAIDSSRCGGRPKICSFPTYRRSETSNWGQVPRT